MSLPEMIDAENSRKHIRVVNVNYPQTIENVKEKKCGIRLRYYFQGFRGGSERLHYQTHMMYLPAGHYSVKEMLKVLNMYVEEYDVTFVLQRGGRVGVQFYPNLTYVRNLSVGGDGMTYSNQMVSSTHKATITGFEIVMTDHLTYMLGLTEWVVHPVVQEAIDIGAYGKTYPMMFILMAAKLPEHYTFYGKFLPDISNGITEFFIYCDEVEQCTVGDVKARLLAIVPINVRGSSGKCFIV
ncbi:Hypothetical predicted protein [Paramuricea clavata]|uniref:Uncharacterized protein n=1 Tax=Paramuricea clavata TaxID=317549 RepID=A0A6S7J776_PARCT|nr:Hypothetical predicted protein [Paramuricea clavata]